MEKFLATIFKELHFPCYMTYRLNEKPNCMVYDIIESPNGSCDDEEELTTYTLMIRLYGTSTQIINYKRSVKELLKKYGFKKVTIPAPVYDMQTGIYQQAMQYKTTIDTNLFLNSSE